MNLPTPTDLQEIAGRCNAFAYRLTSTGASGSEERAAIAHTLVECAEYSEYTAELLRIRDSGLTDAVAAHALAVLCAALVQDRRSGLDFRHMRAALEAVWLVVPDTGNEMTDNDKLADTQRAIIEAAERRGYERGLAERAERFAKKEAEGDTRTLDEQLAHCDGKDCTCLAYAAHECACDVDWTPAEAYKLRAELEALRARIADAPREDASDLSQGGAIPVEWVRNDKRVALVVLEDGE